MSTVWCVTFPSGCYHYFQVINVLSRDFIPDLEDSAMCSVSGFDPLILPSN